MDKNGHKLRHHQIAHLELVQESDIKRMAYIGIIANMSLLWAMTDIWAVHSILPYIGPVLNQDITKIRPDQIAQTKVKYTIFDGQVIFDNH